MDYILKVAFPLDSRSVLKTVSRFHVGLAFKMWTFKFTFTSFETDKEKTSCQKKIDFPVLYSRNKKMSANLSYAFFNRMKQN